jgi:protein-tyrosine phosphatase
LAAVTVSRHLDWDGCFNVRDLGGLRTIGGGRTRWGAVVRADGLDRLTPAGWSALCAYGVRTIVDLRNDDEVPTRGAQPSPAHLTTVRVPLDDLADTRVWEPIWSARLEGSPLYYRPFLDRKPERCAAAIAAIARAEPGGVAVHCVGGRDRTGLVTLLLLALVAVEPKEIALDYELSSTRLRPLWAARGDPDPGPAIAARLARRGTSARALLLDLLAWLDADSYLRGAGLTAEDLSAVRGKLLEPADVEERPPGAPAEVTEST